MCTWGECLQALATLEQGILEKQKRLEDACAKYKKATTLNENRSFAWENWANCLFELAELEPDATIKQALKQEAAEKLQKAEELKAGGK